MLILLNPNGSDCSASFPSRIVLKSGGGVSGGGGRKSIIMGLLISMLGGKGTESNESYK